MSSPRGPENSNLLESLLKENRKFSPPADFKAKARVTDKSPYDEAEKDYQAFWAKHAEQELSWFQKWNKVLDWNPPFAKWFVGGKINVSYNCIDRHLTTWRRTKAAIVWEGEPGDSVTLTYQDLAREVQKFANVLKSLGVRKGDRVTLYMGMVPELAIAMLAIALWRRTDAIFAALAGAGIGAAFHVVTHIRDRDLGGSDTNTVVLAIVAVLLLAGAAWRLASERR